jgi:rSAM/selenodomain-associated transferase 2
MGVSIIIPTLNEERGIERTLRCLKVLQPSPQEIIVVDGGSEDSTVALVKSCSGEGTIPVQLLTNCERGRAVQMNAGAEVAQGAILCFLHGDTLIPDDAIAIMESTLSDDQIAAGGFISLMAGKTTTRWGISLHNYLKTYYAPLLFRPYLFFQGLRLLFGDQVIFCRREDFWQCQGFNPAFPIMEEADLCLKLVQRGRIVQLNRVVQSSDRRVAQWGALKAVTIYLWIGVLWGLGVSATYLKQFYEEVRG